MDAYTCLSQIQELMGTVSAEGFVAFEMWRCPSNLLSECFREPLQGHIPPAEVAI